MSPITVISRDRTSTVTDKIPLVSKLTFSNSAWMPNTELTQLTKESVTEPSEKGKSKLLLLAYEKAAEQNDLAYFKEMLVDHQRAIQEDQEAQAEREAKKASKAKRKSMDTTAQAAEVDDMDVDEEVGDAKPKSKKRKKDLDSDAGDEKVRLFLRIRWGYN